MKVCISIDMDNYRDYQSLVDRGGDGRDLPFYSDAVPRFLDALDRVGARATFFMIGRDADRPENRAAVREIVERGHEVGNHSFSHPYNFRHLPRAQKEKEIREGEDAIADVIGERPEGFRTPSADVDLETLAILRERDYLYDSSVIPSPVMIWTFKLYGKLFVQHSEYNLGLFWSVIAPPWPYFPSPRKLHRPLDPGAVEPPHLVEIPFSTLPLIRVPFYATLFRMFSPGVFDWAVRMHGRKRPTLHMLFHLIDLFDLKGTSLEDALARTPGLGVPIDRRRAFVAHAFECMTAQGEGVALREVAREHLRQTGLPAR
jgi:peptidoglycan/xylan/chitin deacetylase (PgdA/CDA1 family)